MIAVEALGKKLKQTISPRKPLLGSRPSPLQCEQHKFAIRANGNGADFFTRSTP